MEDTNRTILRDFRPTIVNDLEPNDTLPHLSSVLTPKDDAEIKAQSTRQGRCEKLLEILPRKGPNAFKIFVQALKKEAPHLADVLIEADKGTDKELRYAGEQSANLRGQIRDLKTKLETKKQDHAKTSQELEELKCLHETFKTDTSEQIQKLAEIVQHLTAGNSCSSGKALRNLRDSTERETQTSEIRELTKGITKMTEDYKTFETVKREYRSLQKKYRNLSQELAKAKKLQLEDRNKSKEVELKLKEELEKSQRDFEETKTDLANKNERVKEYQQKSKTIDEMDKKLKNAMENTKSLQKKLSEERWKCDTLEKEIKRLRLTLNQMLGQIYSYSEDFDKRETNHGKTWQVNPSSTEIRELEIGQRVELRRLPEGLPEVNLCTRACARQLLPYRCVENCPPCMLPRKPQRRRVNRCK